MRRSVDDMVTYCDSDLESARPRSPRGMDNNEWNYNYLLKAIRVPCIIQMTARWRDGIMLHRTIRVPESVIVETSGSSHQIVVRGST